MMYVLSIDFLPIVNALRISLGGDYMIPLSRDEIVSRFAGILAML